VIDLVVEGGGAPDGEMSATSGWTLVLERIGTTCSPASAAMRESVRWSPMPGKITLELNSEKKPSASAPQRARAWERSWRQARVTSPCPAPSAAS
jgi:hypothetical protein